MEDNKITRFGEPRMKSPAPPSTPPRQFSPVSSQQNGANVKVNGHNNGNEVDFLSLLEKEEADFAEQIKKQKTFLQGVFRDKEELAQMCVTQANKITKLEQSRMDWQRKIIEAEREKRDYLERLDFQEPKVEMADLELLDLKDNKVIRVIKVYLDHPDLLG